MISIRFMVMHVIVRANKKEFQEVKEMCEALEELMYEELEEKSLVKCTGFEGKGISWGDWRTTVTSCVN